MRRVLWIAATLLLPGGPVVAQSNEVAFVNTNVLVMDRERVLEDHTVLIRDGVIQEVAPSHRVRVSEGATVIDGQDLFLMPGLADMHAILPGPGESEEQVEDLLFLYLANNALVVRGALGMPNHLSLKRRVRDREILGPTLYVGSPPLTASNSRDPESTIEIMLANRSAGYDFQVIHDGVSRMVWDSLSEEAHSRGYTFGGLIPDSVGLRYALSTGISYVDHMDGYLPEVVSDPVRARLAAGRQVPLREMLESAVGRKMRAMAAHTRASDTWVIPTLYLWENLYRALDVDSLLTLEEMRYVPLSLRQAWANQKLGSPGEDPETGELLVDVRRRIFRALVLSGAGVLMGTYSPQLFNVPGFSLRHEVESMEAAGLTPYEVLVTGTRNVAEYAQRELLEPGNFGTVAPGNRADLILLRGNPLENLDHLWNQEGVMVRGRWISREEIDGRLARIAERNGG
jgi:hypothetical protein